MKNFKKSSVFVFLTSFVLASSVYAYTPLTSQVGLGAKGISVTNLQTFFADNKSIYPEGLITGYFGGLTKVAVQRFQAAYGLPQVGNVGPLTLAKINGLINSGGWGSASGNTSDTVSPSFLKVSKSVTNNSATFSWETNTSTNGKVFYGTVPVTVNEGDINSVGFANTNGLVASNGNTLQKSQQVIISNLQPNTTYYYIVVATDASGDVSVFDINSTFKTN
jgi:peptidoglycan hydrolase-like protein with peptidoglycan-binding domain